MTISQPGRALQRPVRYIVAAVALGAVTSLTVFLVKASPWLRMPAEPAAAIEARWAKLAPLARAAASSGAADAVAARLDRAIATVRALPRERTDWRRREGAAGARLPDDEISATERSTVEDLVAWHEGCVDCGLPRALAEWRPGREPDGRIVLGSLVPLLRLPLVHAERGDSVELAAALHLAFLMRRDASLLVATMGVMGADETLRAAAARGFTPEEAFRRYRPAAAEAIPVAARVACSLDETGHTLELTAVLGLLRWPRVLDSEAPWPPLGIVRPARERLVLHQYGADVLEVLERPGIDLAAAATELEELDQRRPPSVLVHTAPAHFRTFLKRLGAAVAAYDRALGVTD